MRFRDKLIKFMYGRYGVDELGRDLLYLALGFSLLSIVLNIFHVRTVTLVLSLLSILVMIFIIFRALSRNINRRVMENHKYLAKTEKIRTKFRFWRQRFRERKTYRYVRCPHCKNYSRVPRGKGKIKITCRVCKKQFEKKV